jgi:hypothetical protein
MLVVMGLVVVLFTLAAAVAPNINDRQRVNSAAGQLQNWLLVAKQRALRDQVPRGVRLIQDADGLVRTVQYLEQPEDFTGGTVYTLNSPPAAIGSASFRGDYEGYEPLRGPVQAGDYLQILGKRTYRIDVGPKYDRITLTLAPTPAPDVIRANEATPAYRIIRKPRLAVGEPPLTLPRDIVVDLNPGRSIITPEPALTDTPSTYDIVFSPAGEVLRVGGTTGKVILWVRDATQDASKPGDQILVTVYSRTGLISTHPVNLTPDGNGNVDFYSFTRDGRSSGL